MRKYSVSFIDHSLIMRRILLIFCGVAMFLSSMAQEGDFAFAKPSSAEFEMKQYAKDSSANAVVLNEFGKARMQVDENLNLIFEHHVRIKIFNEKGFKNGNIQIVLRKNDNNTFESIDGIEAVTFYPDEQGLIRESRLDPKQIFRENKNKYRELVKFAMPNLRSNCIIEYRYSIRSPFIFNYKTWNFQSDIPKVNSKFIARIPAAYNYNISLRGPYKLTNTSGTVERDCFTPGGGFKADCSVMTYSMADVPAFIEEDNMTAPSNFLSAMYFELAEYTDARGIKHKVTQEWSSVDREMKIDERFGNQLKKKDFFKDKIGQLIGSVQDPLEKAKLIYDYLRKWYRWNEYYGVWSENGIKKAFDMHTGNVADINLSLTAAMLYAGLDAEAVMLSTRQNGVVNQLFPVMSDFDYVISKVNINGESYLLDATEPLLPFGLLPLRCINDKGRVMSLTKPSYWIDLKASQKERKTYSLDLALQEDGKLKGKVSFVSFGYAAYYKRLNIKKENSVEEFVEKLQERMPKTRILDFKVHNLDSLENPVTEEYEVEIDAFDNLDKERLFFNPFFMDRISENPFKLAERTYPVDLGAPSETRVVLQLRYPEKFELVSKPADVGLGLPNKGGRFLMQVNQEENKLTFLQLTQLDQSVYYPEEYPYLKELFNKIVLSQKSDIVLKRKL